MTLHNTRAHELDIDPLDPLPCDPEDMNDARSVWAGDALTLFAKNQGLDMDPEGEEHFTAVQDLLCDLMHYCDRHPLAYEWNPTSYVGFAEALESARNLYLEETHCEEEG